MGTEQITIEVPKNLVPYLTGTDQEFLLKRNAMLLYPYIRNKTLSHGKAAEILGIHKLDLIDLYEQMGFSYLDQTMDELEQDLMAMEKLGFMGHSK